MEYVYKYPHPAITTDCCIFSFLNGELSVLLIRRGIEPFEGMWALPGGFMKIDETAEDCALRELREETHYVATSLRQFHTYSETKRDPRERVVTIAFYALVRHGEVSGGDDAREASWFPVRTLPELAFDHERIIHDALMAMRRDIYFEPIGFELLPKTFSMAELQKIIETITGESYDRRNFYNKMRHMEFVQEAETSIVAEIRASKAPHACSGSVRSSSPFCNIQSDEMDIIDIEGVEVEDRSRKRRSGVRYSFNSVAFQKRKDKKGNGPITY